MTRSIIGLAALAILLPWVAAEDAAPPAFDSPRAAQDLVYFGDARPILIRLQITLDGKPYRDAWQDFVKEVFQYLDRDNDGILLKDEFGRSPSPPSLLSGILFAGRDFTNFRQLDADPTDGRVTLKELTAYYEQFGGNSFQAQIGQNASAAANALTESLIERLDANKDGKLSRAELVAAAIVLRKYDLDDDELVSTQELGPNPYMANSPNVFFQPQPQMGTPLADTAAFLALQPEEPTSRLTRQLQARYGPADARLANKKLSRADLGMDAEAFAALDLNKDGMLDVEELGRFARRTADVTIRVQLAQAANTKETTTIRLPPKDAGVLADRARDAGPGAIALELGNARLELRGERGDPRFVVAGGQIEVYIMQFKMADTDNNGYLDMKEAETNPFFGNVFRTLALEKDDKLFEKDLRAYVEKVQHLQQRAAGSRVSLTVTEGQGLFELLDTNADGRFSVRELHNAAGILARLDRDGDGQLARGEIPRNFQLTFGRGQVTNNQFRRAVVLGGMAPPPPTASVSGPRWFIRMDRNRDGDVSTREFLGSKEDFQRIDTDNDSLISADEAIKADRELRTGGGNDRK